MADKTEADEEFDRMLKEAMSHPGVAEVLELYERFGKSMSATRPRTYRTGRKRSRVAITAL